MHHSASLECTIFIIQSVARLRHEMNSLGPLSPDPPGQLDVLGHDGDPLGVDGAQVGVLEQPDQVCFGSFLESHHGRRLEPRVADVKEQPITVHAKMRWQQFRIRRSKSPYLRSVLKSWAISLTRRWKGSLRISSSVDFWYLEKIHQDCNLDIL